MPEPVCYRRLPCLPRSQQKDAFVPFEGMFDPSLYESANIFHVSIIAENGQLVNKILVVV